MDYEMIKDWKLEDKLGNILSVSAGEVILFRKENNRTLKLGRIVEINGELKWIKREKEREIFRKTNSWSIPYELFNYLPEDIVIEFTTEKYKYSISKRKILEYSKNHDIFLWFQKSGIEKKIYIPLREWTLT